MNTDTIAREMRQHDPRPFWKKAIIFCLCPRASWAGLRFARTGAQIDYWRHEYWIRGSKGIAELIIHKDKLVADYSKAAYKYRLMVRE